MKPEYVVWDIETGVNDQAHKFAPVFKRPESIPIEDWPTNIPFSDEDGLEAPKTHKKPETVLSWVEGKFIDWEEKRALRCLSARILAIGVTTMTYPKLFHGLDERDVLEGAWEHIRALHLDRVSKMVGFYSSAFDLPMLVGRSQLLGVNVPSWAHDMFQNSRSDFWWDLQNFLHADLKGLSLDKTCDVFGLEGKTGQGKDFEKVYLEDSQKGLDYLVNDLNITRALAERVLP